MYHPFTSCSVVSALSESSVQHDVSRSLCHKLKLLGVMAQVGCLQPSPNSSFNADAATPRRLIRTLGSRSPSLVLAGKVGSRKVAVFGCVAGWRGQASVLPFRLHSKCQSCGVAFGLQMVCRMLSGIALRGETCGVSNLTARSSGPATACRLRASFHSGPAASCRCGPLSSNVRCAPAPCRKGA